MKIFRITLSSIQHIKSFSFELDLGHPGILCIVGRNGVGKTTIIRAMRNFTNSDTFIKTAQPHIFSADSRIEYVVDGQEFVYTYDTDIHSINSKDVIPQDLRVQIAAELPMPHGARFNYFKSASDADSTIRKSLATNSGVQPKELIHFLSDVYNTPRYDNLIEVRFKNKPFYAIPLENFLYIREDYLSSGEYFLINLYRIIKGGAKLIVIDEIDLSLDAAAQVHLSRWLRSFCEKYDCTILFTTHSLAVMQTLRDGELVYMQADAGAVSHIPASFNYVKSRLFGFKGWDRYILTEDSVLKNFLEYVIAHHCTKLFFSYKIIYIGGAVQVTDLLQRNETEEFFAQSSSVLAILDGDQRELPHAKRPGVHVIPLESVEKTLFLHHEDDGFPFKFSNRKFSSGKELFNAIQQQKMADSNQIFEYLCCRYKGELAELISTLNEFFGSAAVEKLGETGVRVEFPRDGDETQLWPQF